MASRLINQAEIELARQVFQDQLPYDKIHFASYYLPNNNGVPVTLASVSSLVPIRSLRSYTIYFGPEVFRDGAHVPGTRNTLIHELTHVWQGTNRRHAFDYILDSVYNQIRFGKDAYDLNQADVGKKKWSEFNAEQQAMIVENWYAGGMSESDDAFTYIKDNIRARTT